MTDGDDGKKLGALDDLDALEREVAEDEAAFAAVPRERPPSAAKLAFAAHRLAERERTLGRVAEIAELMAKGRWTPGIHGVELAKKWGVSLSSVRSYSSRASLQVSGGMHQEAIEEARTVSVARLQMISIKAEAKGELRVAVDATVQAAKLAGVAYAPITHRVIAVSADGSPSPAFDAILRASSNAAVEATLAHIRQYPDDFEGARIRGREAAHRASLATVVEAAESEVSQGGVSPDIIELPPEDDLGLEDEDGT